MALAAVGVTLMVAGSIEAGALAVVLPDRDDRLVRRRDRDHALPARRVDDARECASQALVVVVAAPFASLGSATPGDWGLFFLLGTFQIGAGLALLTIGARLLPPAEVALLSLLELVLGPLWVWLAYSERPSTATLVGGAVVTAAVIVQATASDEPIAAPDRLSVPVSDTS